jgi:hypothetical protein
MKNTIIGLAALALSFTATAEETTVIPVTKSINDYCIQLVADSDISLASKELARNGFVMSDRDVAAVLYLGCMNKTLKEFSKNFLDKRRGI